MFLCIELNLNFTPDSQTFLYYNYCCSLMKMDVILNFFLMGGKGNTCCLTQKERGFYQIYLCNITNDKKYCFLFRSTASLYLVTCHRLTSSLRHSLTNSRDAFLFRLYIRCLWINFDVLSNCALYIEFD